MSVMLSHYPPSPSSLLRSSSPSSPSPRRVRSNPPQSRPSARAMSNLQVNSTVTPGLLSLSRPPSNQRSKQPTAAKKQQGESKSEQQPPRTPQPKLVPSNSNDSSSKPNPSTAKPSTTAATTTSSSDAIPQPTVPQVPTPGKQRRTRRPKRSNSDPLFPTPSSPKENQQDVDESPKTSNPPRTPGPSSSTPSGKASSPPRASTSDQSLGPNTPTPASKSARARGGGGGGGRRNEKSSTTLVAEPTPIPSSRAPPEADPNEHLYHSAPSESSFMLGPEPAAPSGDGKRARGRSGKASKKKEGSGGSGREDAFVLDEEEGKVWDMPEKKGTDQLTWQQSLVSSSTPQFSSISSPSNNRRSSPAPRNARATLSFNVVAPQATSQHRHTASLTWQQALLPTLPPPAPSSNSAPATMRRRNSLSMSGLCIHGTSATPMRMDDSSKQRHSMLSVLSTPTKTTAIMPKEDAVGGRVGPRYAGGTFQNSPMAGDLPKPRFGGRM